MSNDPIPALEVKTSPFRFHIGQFRHQGVPRQGPLMARTDSSVSWDGPRAENECFSCPFPLTKDRFVTTIHDFR